MKYIIIGLGRFGSRLGSSLTEMGHEVIGIDNDMDKCEEIKDSITSSLKMDCTNMKAVRSLPLDDVDAVIVAIGEDVGASILTLSVLKKFKVKRIIGRAVNQIHHNILTQIGIDEVILPLEDSAIHVSAMLQLRNAYRVTEITDDFVIAEVLLPEKYSGHSLDTVNIQDRFEIKVVAFKRAPEKDLMGTIFKRNYRVIPFYDKDDLLLSTDILILAGKISDIKRFIES
jgi:trk system potassium uptake protein TrkA